MVILWQMIVIWQLFVEYLLTFFPLHDFCLYLVFIVSIVTTFFCIRFDTSCAVLDG
jgi:hypothetical protein